MRPAAAIDERSWCDRRAHDLQVNEPPNEQSSWKPTYVKKIEHTSATVLSFAGV